MKTILTPDRDSMGRWVAKHAADDLNEAIQAKGHANIVVATGSSQFEVLRELVAREDVDWKRVTGFHLDEYIGVSPNHPASFCGYLRDRFVSKAQLSGFRYLRGDHDPQQTVKLVGNLLAETEIDVALVGIGENGHLAFNDPPADFDTEAPYLIVELDEPCRQQQVGEGWFASLDDVPTHAISMSVRQILKSKRIYCSVPDERKADAVRDTIEGAVSPSVPASILRQHPATTLIIDTAAASKLSDSARRELEVIT